MSKKTTRRSFVTGAAVVAAGAVTAAADAQTGQTRQRARQIDRNALRQVQTAETSPINPNAQAVMPGGDLVDRGEILTRLGLDPNTPADAWLVITSCGINGAALSANQLNVLQRGGAMENLQDVQLPARGGRQRH